MIDLPEPIIEYRDVRVSYGEKRALSGVTLEIPRGRVTVLIGPSGCGKSTTLRTLNRLVPFSSGEILYDGRDIRKEDVTDLRRSMGYAIQHVGLIPHLTVMENVALVPRLLGWSKSRRQERAAELLDLVGLDVGEYGGKYAAQLSGGEAQRVGVARALGADPPVLLLDEPFGAVDPLKREELQDEFIRIQRRLKKSVIFVTHDLDEAVRLADYLAIMRDGEIVQAARPDELLAHPGSDFVTDFLGPDRPLKRLSLFTADRIMHSIADRQSSSGIIWKRGEGGVITAEHAENHRTVRQLMPGAQTVHAYSSLKECMSRILALGLPAVPVLDDSGTLIGEVLFEDIQDISFEH